MTDTASPRTRHGGHATARGELVIASPTFADWLAATDCALALTTYQAGRLFLIGRKPDG